MVEVVLISVAEMNQEKVLTQFFVLSLTFLLAEIYTYYNQEESLQPSLNFQRAHPVFRGDALRRRGLRPRSVRGYAHSPLRRTFPHTPKSWRRGVNAAGGRVHIRCRPVRLITPKPVVSQENYVSMDFGSIIPSCG